MSSSHELWKVQGVGVKKLVVQGFSYQKLNHFILVLQQQTVI